MTTTSNPSDPARAALTTTTTEAFTAAPKIERVKIRGRIMRLLITIAPANLALTLVYGGVISVLLPLQITGLDPANKVANLAVITTIGAFAAMLAQPIAGRISDRTRSRFGKRAPWLIFGVIVGALALIGMGLANGLVQIAIAFVIVQIAFNFIQGPLSAIVPDRVPAGAFGIFASVLGVLSMIGSIAGQALGASFAKSIGAGYFVLAGVAIVIIVLFVVLNPDHSSKEDVKQPFTVTDFLRTFWVSPRKHPDFFWAFLGRALLFTGYFAVLGYNLFVLQDYIGLKDDAVTYVPILGLLQLVGIVPATIISGVISDRIGRRKIFVFISSVIVGVGLIVPIVSPTVTGMFIQSVVCGFGFGAFLAVDQALMNQVLPSAESYGKDLGVVNIAATLPQTLAPAVGGAIVLVVGYVGLFPVGIVLSLLGAFAVFFIRGVR